MRYSDQTNATTALMSNATIGGSGLIRRFAGNKISKVCTGHVMNFAIFPSKIRFLHDQSEPTNRFITGSWNSVGHGNLTLWTVRQGATVFGRDEGEEIERSSRIELGQTDVNDLWFVPWGRALLVIRWKVSFMFSVINAQQFVTATVSGEVRIVDCPLDETNGNSVGLAQMSTMATYARVHKSHPNLNPTGFPYIYSGNGKTLLYGIHPTLAHIINKYKSIPKFFFSINLILYQNFPHYTNYDPNPQFRCWADFILRVTWSL